MPLQGTFSWTEKKDQLKISIPLKGTSISKVDVFVTETTLKVNFSPYITEVLFWKEVNALKHKASVRDGVLIVTLYKKEQGLWGILEKEADAAQKEAAKKEALISNEALNVELAAKRKDKILADEKHALRKQMSIEEEERARIEGLKADEKRTAEESVYKSFAELNEQRASSAKQSKKVKKSVNFAVSGVPLNRESTVGITAPADGLSNQAQAAPAQQEKENDIFKKTDIIQEGNRERSLDWLLENDDIDFDVDEVIANVENSKAVSAAGGGGGGARACSETKSEQSGAGNEDDELDVVYIPPPRSSRLDAAAGDGKVAINFTPRVFPTPMRESKIAEEEDWVAKNRRHLNTHGVLGAKGSKGQGVDISEEDPAWLKAKGDDFFRSGDSRSALHAYGAAIDALLTAAPKTNAAEMESHDPALTACFANRSACYLKLGMAAECKADCTSGIRQLTAAIRLENVAEPIVGDSESAVPERNSSDRDAAISKHAAMLVKLLVRRGSSNSELGLFREALTDYHQAHSKYGLIRGSDAAKKLSGLTLESIQADIENLRQLSSADSLKKEADACFADSRMDEAIDTYSRALDLIPVHVSCLSNRAACWMAQGKLQECVEDCTAAIDILQYQEQESFSTNSAVVKLGDSIVRMAETILPARGSEKRKTWLIKTITRRAVALAQLSNASSGVHSSPDSHPGKALEQLEQAVADFERACSLDPANEALRSDLSKIRNNRERIRKSSHQQKQSMSAEQ